MENINEEFVNSLLKIDGKKGLGKTCNRNVINLESINDIPNPQNNTYKIRKLKMDVQTYSNMNNEINSTVHYKPFKYVNNLNKSLDHVSFEKNIVYIQRSHMKLLRKYFNLWKIKWIQARNKKHLIKLQEDHRLKVTNFLEVLQKRKELIEQEEKIKPKITRSANTKSKKLHPSRKTCSAPSLSKNNYVEETRLNIIENDINKSIIETKSDIKSLTLPKLKTCFVKVNKDDKKPKLFAKIPETIMKSQELAKQREEKRAILSDKKRLFAEQMKRTLEEVELMQKRVELEYKKQKLKEYKDKKRKEEEKIDRNLKEKLRWIELFKKSKNHFNMKLKQKFFSNLKQLCDNSVAKLHTAGEFYEMNLLQKHFIKWKQSVQNKIQLLNSKADKHYQRKIFFTYFRIWSEKHNVSVVKNQVAVDYYEFKLVPKIFGIWHEYSCLQYIHWQDLKGTAMMHYNCTLKRRYFITWKKYMKITKSEKEKGKRLQKWIRRVQEIIPNFEPIRE